ncbi:MAG: LytTR family DNA-binding domain-containing protein [Saprospiraceae bacterium]
MENKLTAIIIDDMELARLSLKADINDHCPNIEVIGEAEGVLSAAKLLKNIVPDILFLDIEMEDGTGFDLLDILPSSIQSVIFVTARQDYALKAFQYSAFDYLLKPIDPELLIKAVGKISNQKQQRKAQLEILKDGLDKSKTLNKIALHTSEKIVVIAIKDIIRMEAMTNYTQFFFVDGTKLLITKTLKEYDKMLGESGFVRVHQSHLINMDQVKAYVKTEGGYITMKDDSMVPVSIRKKPYVMRLLK